MIDVVRRLWDIESTNILKTYLFACQYIKRVKLNKIRNSNRSIYTFLAGSFAHFNRMRLPAICYMAPAWLITRLWASNLCIWYCTICKFAPMFLQTRNWAYFFSSWLFTVYTLTKNWLLLVFYQYKKSFVDPKY